MKRSVRVMVASVITAASLGLVAGPAFAGNSQGQQDQGQHGSNSQGVSQGTQGFDQQP
jgi:hypothetical protein